jgi:dTDP-4-amino-4,6-dideoxygalactose transaminase
MADHTTPPVPLCDVPAQYAALKPEIDAAVQRVLASGQVIGGPEVAALESEVAASCGAAFAVACSSGSDALLLALHALGVRAGDEVILPPFTFFATVGAVVRLGARPVFADIDPATYNLDPAQVENRITPRTRAIMPVHLFGQCADMEPLWRIAERHGLPIVEDAAQSFGAEYQGKHAGTLGAIACLSFYPTKNLGACGDAGMCVTSDPEWAARMLSLRNHGMAAKRYYHSEVGWNSRLDAVQAAILRVKLPHVEKWNANRLAAAKRYDTLIESHHLSGFVQRPVAKAQRKHVWNQYVVRVARGARDELVKYLRGQGVGCEVYYPLPLHLQECVTHLGYRCGDFPASEEACRTVLALPMFPEITPEQQERVVAAIGDFVRQQVRRAA